MVETLLAPRPVGRAAFLGELAMDELPPFYGVMPFHGLTAATTNTLDLMMLREENQYPDSPVKPTLKYSSFDAEDFLNGFADIADDHYDEVAANKIRARIPPAGSKDSTAYMVKPRDPAQGSDTYLVLYEGDGSVTNPYAYKVNVLQRCRLEMPARVLAAFAAHAISIDTELTVGVNRTRLTFVPNSYCETVKISAGLPKESYGLDVARRWFAVAKTLREVTETKG